MVVHKAMRHWDHKVGIKRTARVRALRAANCRKKKGKNPFRGVFRHHTGKWRAQIMVHRKTIHLGTYTNPVEAAKVYDAAASIAFGEFAHKNFV